MKSVICQIAVVSVFFEKNLTMDLLHADVVFTGFFATSSDWGDNDDVALLGRKIDNAAKEFTEAISRKSVLKAFGLYDPEHYLTGDQSFGYLLGGFTDR